MLSVWPFPKLVSEERLLATRPQRGLTYEDYVRFPEDGRRWELLDGEAYMVPSPTPDHQDVVLRLAQQVAAHLDERAGGRVFIAPLDLVLAESNVVQPDVVFVSDADAHVISEKNIRGAPTWIVEVVSDPVRDKKAKRDLYARYGVAEYWAVDPAIRQVEIYRAGEAAEVAEPPARPTPRALPELHVDLEAIFGPSVGRRAL